MAYRKDNKPVFKTIFSFTVPRACSQWAAASISFDLKLVQMGSGDAEATGDEPLTKKKRIQQG
jgi:hypothetical protein